MHRLLVCRFLYRFWRKVLLDVLVLKGVPESRRNAHKVCRQICGVTVAFPGWVPYFSSAFLSTQHVTVTQSPPGSSLGPKHACVCSKIQKENSSSNPLCEPLASRYLVSFHRRICMGSERNNCAIVWAHGDNHNRNRRKWRDSGAHSS